MAINDEVPGLEVFVRCNGQTLAEYEDPHADDNNDVAACPMTTKYIECIDDAEFEVTIRIHSDYQWGYRNHVVGAATYVDGQFIQHPVFRNDKIRASGYAECHIRGPERYSDSNGSWLLQKFKFAAVKTIDDTRKERVESELEVAENLGTIEVEFKRIIEVGPTSGDGTRAANSSSLELAERSLKGKEVSHGTSYGAGQVIKAPNFISSYDIEEDNGPILIIRFIYRSRDALKREFIIPRTPSVSPSLDDLTPAERDRLARERLDQLREMKIKQENIVPTIKREFGEIVDLTTEAPAPPATKKTRLSDGRQVDVIDLTDD